MVTKRYLEEKFLNPWLERREAEEQRKEEEKQQAVAEKEMRRWVAWYRRKLVAQEKGEPFDEPNPDLASWSPAK